MALPRFVENAFCINYFSGYTRAAQHSDNISHIPVRSLANLIAQAIYNNE